MLKSLVWKWDADGSGSAVAARVPAAGIARKVVSYIQPQNPLLGGGHTESSYDKEIREIKGVLFYKFKKRMT